MRKFPDPPPPEETDIVLVDSVTIATAFRHVGACEGCSKKADMPFDWLLDATTGRNPATTDYVMEAPARCPRCRRGITEKTLVEVSEE
jgi:hypothetical protein